MPSLYVEFVGAELQIQEPMHVQPSLTCQVHGGRKWSDLTLVTEQAYSLIFNCIGWLTPLIPSNSHVVQGSMVFIVIEFTNTQG